MIVTIERDGYMVDGEVGGADTGPGLAPGLEVRELVKAWISSPGDFVEAHGGGVLLSQVIEREHAEIFDDLIDAAHLRIADGRDDFDADDVAEECYR